MNNDILNTLLKGASKSLYIINEALPIYKDTAPVVKKVKDFVVNKKGNIDLSNVIKKKNDIVKEEKKDIKKELVTKQNSNNPKFFV